MPSWGDTEPVGDKACEVGGCYSMGATIILGPPLGSEQYVGAFLDVESPFGGMHPGRHFRCLHADAESEFMSVRRIEKGLACGYPLPPSAR